MVHVFIRHRVADYTSWKKVFDAFAPTRRAGGELAYTVTHVMGEPNHLCLSFDWDSAANAERFLASAELAKAMMNAGVSEKPYIYVTEEVAKGKP